MGVASWFNQTLSIEKASATTTNRFGTKSTGGASVTEKARIQRTRRTFIGAGGRESEIRAVIYTKTSANIAREDIVTIDGEKMHVLDVRPEVHGSGTTHHLKVLAGTR